jgi:hypothetical protein
MSVPSPYTAGPRLADDPRGDPAAQAIASLRGYAYQLYASALAWMELRNGQELHLEVAKDYATVAKDALNAVEVKDTQASVTINLQDVRDTLDAFVDLVERNPGREVTLRFLSTAPIGVERSTKHRAGSEGALNYWRRAAAGADIAPLRQVLSELDLTPKVRAYIDARDDTALRKDFLRPLHWHCGRPPLDDLRSDLEAAIVTFGADRLHLPPSESSRISGLILERVLATVVKPLPRRLTASDLLTLFEDATRISLPRHELDALVRSLANQIAGQQSGAQSPTIEDVRILDSERDIPLPVTLAERPALVADIHGRMNRNGIAFVTGGTGFGKTILARLSARAHGGNWYVVDLRDVSAPEAAELLHRAAARFSLVNPEGIILDDLNEIEDPTVRRSLNRMMLALQRRDALCVVTAYREPSARAISELGIDPSAHVAVPDLTVEEVGQLVTAAGGDAATWAKWVHAGGEFGHPQLVQAIIVGLRARSWPQAELQSLKAYNRAPEVETEQRATRQRLVAAVPEDAKSLLYRMSLFIGRFNRPLVLAVAGLAPAIGRPGEQLDSLIGPWVDQAAQDELRISPLLVNAGKEILGPVEQEAVHRAVAEAILEPRQLDITKANAAFLHALLGKAEVPLTKFGYSILMANPRVRRMLPDWMTTLRLHRTDRPIYPEKPYLSGLLRLGQLLLLLEKENLPNIRSCWNALIVELEQETNIKARERFEFIILSKVLVHSPFASAIPGWIEAVLRFHELSAVRPEGKKLLESMKQPVDGKPSPSPVGMFFITQAHGVLTVANLGAAFDKFDALTPDQRQFLFADVFAIPGDFGMLVNHAWLEEHKTGNIDWLTCAQLYERMAAQAQSWGYRELALRCHVARGVMFDEYGSADDRALKALDEAEKSLGADPVLSRARAKILYRRKDHAGALKLLREAAAGTALNDPVERTFMLREAGISAGELGAWADARKWFAAARESACLAKGIGMRPMAVGLRADEAIAAFRSNDASASLTGMDLVLEELDTVDSKKSIKGAYCHRVVGHTILWLYGQTTMQRVTIAGEDFGMVPGMCSNSEPPDLRDLPLASRDYLRYFLAEAEIATGATAGIVSGLRQRLKNRAIPAMEIGVRNASLARAIKEHDAPGFVQHLTAWVDADLYLKANIAALQGMGPTTPAYGEIESATPERWQTSEALLVIEDALLSFGLAAALAGNHAVIASLHDRWAETMPEGFPGGRILKIMAKDEMPGDRLEDQIAAQVRKVAQNTGLDPDDIFVAGLRFTEAVKRSNFKRHLEPTLCTWTKQRWQYALDEQRFLLRNPLQTSTAIEHAVASDKADLNSTGRILLAAEPAVRSQLGQSFRDYLQAL